MDLLIILGIAILYFHKNISNYLHSISYIKTLYTITGVQSSIISCGVMLILVWIFIYFTYTYLKVD